MNRAKANLTLDRNYIIGAIDPRLHGSFVEHLGRAVYDGLYCPGHPTADGDGFRSDVMQAVRALQPSIIRYPGGNFVSAYRWEDGVGPREQRPLRLDRAWRTLETNEIGLNEFSTWCQKINADLMMAVNLGTRGIDDACNLLEYCNLATGTQYADQRRAHGVEQPYGVKTWCLGNEMDGPWQIGHKTAEEYGRLACETARAMRRIDDSIELVSSGSSYPDMPTFPQWEATTLGHTYDEVDYVSMHQYLGDTTHDRMDYLAKSLTMDRFIRTVEATCDFVKAQKRSSKTMMLSFDEWNIWYHSVGSENEEMRLRPWQKAPSLVEDIYTMADALVFGTMITTLLNHADRVKIACLAQLVNVIAPVMTQKNGGAMWRQTIYWPFMQFATMGRGTALHGITQSPVYQSKTFSDVPYLESAAVLNEDESQITVFAVNRHPETELKLDCKLLDFQSFEVVEHTAMFCDDLNSTNGPGQETIQPRQMPAPALTDNQFSIPLPPASWNVITLSKAQPT